MRSNLADVFNERDPQKREAAISALYAEEATFADPEGIVSGHAEIAVKIKALLDQDPDLHFSQRGDVRVCQNLGMLSWELGPDGGSPVLTGTDVGQVSDGKIFALYTLLDS